MTITPSRDELESLLFRALQSDNGLKVVSTSSDRLRQNLYRIKRTDEMFAPLSFSLVDDRTLIILKQKDTPDAAE